MGHQEPVELESGPKKRQSFTVSQSWLEAAAQVWFRFDLQPQIRELVMSMLSSRLSSCSIGSHDFLRFCSMLLVERMEKFAIQCIRVCVVGCLKEGCHEN